MMAALNLADTGFEVHLVEREPHFGGQGEQADEAFGFFP